MSAIWRSLESPPGTPQAPREPLFPPMIQRLHFQNVSRLVAQELVEMTLLPLRYLGFGPPTDHLAPRLKWNTLEFLRSLGQNVAAESTPSSCLQPAPFSSYLGSVLAARTSCNPQPTLPNSSHNLQAAWRSALQQGSLFQEWVWDEACTGLDVGWGHWAGNSELLVTSAVQKGSVATGELVPGVLWAPCSVGRGQIEEPRAGPAKVESRAEAPLHPNIRCFRLGDPHLGQRLGQKLGT